MLGGSSAINGQAFIPASSSVIDAWASLGNSNWTWDQMAPYYRKFHTLDLPKEPERRKHLGLDHLDESTHGKSGPVKVYYATPMSEPLAPAWTETFRRLGFEAMSDPASGAVVGGFSSPATIDAESKERSHSANAHWKQAWGRPNLHLLTDTTVKEVLLRGHDGDAVATGVNVIQQGGETKRISARREVILATGAYQTPKLLELSGIGNADLLMGKGIKPRIANSGVGENLQDHLMTGISFEVNDDVQTLDALRMKDPAVTQAAEEAYNLRKEGPYALGGFNYYSVMPIVHSTLSQCSSSPPFTAVLAAHPSALDAKGNPGLERQYAFLSSVLQSPTQGSGGIYLSPRGTTYGASSRAQDYSISSLPGKYITLGLTLLQPFSRGSVHIASEKYEDKPIIDPGALSNPLDVEVMASHLAFIETLATTSPLKGFLKPGGRRNADEATGKDREKAREWARRSALSQWHPCGTCAMMGRELGGVVGERLVVHGSRNLRIVDASVMPIIPRGNIQSSVYMVAERAADLIKEDHALLV